MKQEEVYKNETKASFLVLFFPKHLTFIAVLPLNIDTPLNYNWVMAF